jgi:hypothetical protein
VPHFLDTPSPYHPTKISLGRGATRFPKKSHRSPPNECQIFVFTLEVFKRSKVSSEICKCFSGKPHGSQNPAQTMAVFGGEKGHCPTANVRGIPSLVRKSQGEGWSKGHAKKKGGYWNPALLRVPVRSPRLTFRTVIVQRETLAGRCRCCTGSQRLGGFHGSYPIIGSE